MAMRKFLILLISIIFLISACGDSSSAPSEIDLTLTSAYQTAAAPLPTSTVVPTATQTPVPTNTPDIRIKTEILDVLNLRAGPSALHDAIGVGIVGEFVYAKGRDPENNWIYVDYDDPEAGRVLTGWMSADYLQVYGNIQDLPLAPYPNDLVVRGSVIDTEGNLIPNVKINVVVWINEDRADTTQSTTDSNGEFVFYLPENFYGQAVTIEAIGPNCGSPMVNSNCEMQYFEVVDSEIVTIPFSGSVTFVYEKATSFLKGKVTTRGGWALDKMIVYAQREEDGADSQTLTDIGEFVLPLGEGTWRIIAIRTIIYWPDQESDPIFVLITPGVDPESIHLIGPWEEPSND